MGNHSIAKFERLNSWHSRAFYSISVLALFEWENVLAYYTLVIK